MIELIKPHGGTLVNRVTDIEAGAEKSLEKVLIDSRTAMDLELIGVGAYSPIEGFMVREDYESVVEKMRMSSYVPWSIPITLAVDDEKSKKLREGDDIALVSENGKKLAGILHLEDKYVRDREKEAELVYGTNDIAHPGVRYLYSCGETLIGGKIELVKQHIHNNFSEYRLDPLETRKLFVEKGWKTIVGFQTRNPIHRAHEYIQKCALEMVDGLFIHPLVGETKDDDIPADLRMKCYELLIKNYYPRSRVLLSVFPAAMRYAGPREAIFHALVRKNYGCTHFTVGRDHAGVGNFYGTFDAQNIFYEFEPCEIEIVPLMFEHVFYCKKCGHMASHKTCSHREEERVSLSGTKVREILNRKEMLPEEFTRPEIARILIEANGETQKKERKIAEVQDEA